MEKVLFWTAGDGYWSNVQRAVKITALSIGYVNDEEDFGELRVFFNLVNSAKKVCSLTLLWV